jgi:hypothetical protein
LNEEDNESQQQSLSELNNLANKGALNNQQLKKTFHLINSDKI